AARARGWGRGATGGGGQSPSGVLCARRFAGGPLTVWGAGPRPPAAPAELPAAQGIASATPQAILTRREVYEQLERCLSRLDERERAIVRARAAGEGYDEICESLRVEKGAAYKTFHKATARLAGGVKRDGSDSAVGYDI